MYIYQSQSRNSSHLPFPLGIYTFVLYLCLCFCFANKIICTIFLDSTYMYQYYSICFPLSDLTSVCMTVSRTIHVSTNDSVSFLFMAEWYSFLKFIYFNWRLITSQYCWIIFFIHSSVDGNLACFHVLAVVNGAAAINIGVHVSFQIMVFSKYMPRSGIAGSCGSSVFSV